MNRILLFLSTFCLIANYGNAQLVEIPDDNFADYLSLYYPDCMDGNMMDISCSSIQEVETFFCINQGIENFQGLQFFESAVEVYIGQNLIESLTVYPPNIELLDVTGSPNLINVGGLPSGLLSFHANSCAAMNIPEFPQGLLNCNLENNGLTQVPDVPLGLEMLSLSANPLIEPFEVPSGLTSLSINECGLSDLPELPETLEWLNCSFNNLTTIDDLPETLIGLTCGSNNISSIGMLPQSLLFLTCSDNSELTTLPELPQNLDVLTANSCSLESVPALPDELWTINLGSNQLTYIESFPTFAGNINVDNNQLSSLPEIPPYLNSLSATNNNISCLPVLPYYCNYWLNGNPFTCVPNITDQMIWDSYWDDFPVCESNDPENNPMGCDPAIGIEGYLYEDGNQNCMRDFDENGISNAAVKLYNEDDIFVGLSTSNSSGLYHFTSLLGEYTVFVDTANSPFVSNCDYPGIDSLVVTTEIDSLVSNVDFPFECPEQADLGVFSCHTDGWVFPGESHSVQITAGDLSAFYGLNCAAGIAGMVSVELSGPIEGFEVIGGTADYTIDGMSIVYVIEDFGSIDIFSEFLLELVLETTADVGDFICLNVQISFDESDSEPGNDEFECCYPVVNSYDPNNKLVYPASVEPLYNDWLHYTINFQNTGNAPAFNIRLEDELSDLLDLETFQVTGYSHDYHFDIVGNDLTVYYPNIMLADSLTNEPESKGYFQYRIKPISGLPLGTEIENTAGIFFDYNDPIITNTAVTTYEEDLSVSDWSTTDQMKVYPNPSKGFFQVKLLNQDQLLDIYVADLLGRPIDISWKNQGTQAEVNVDQLAKGQYVLQVLSADGWFSQHILIE